MPAVARPKPAAKAPAKSAPQVHAKRSRTRPPAPPPAYAPAKLEAARGVGLAPKAAVGVALLAILGVLGAAMLTGDRMETVRRGLDATVSGLGFAVEAVHVQGASPETERAVLAAAGVERRDNILGVDLPGVRGRVGAVSWVEDAKVVRLLPDTLVIAVTERRPLAVWQSGGRLVLVDGQGQVIQGADAAKFPQLPLVVGPGAGQAAGAILPLLHARPALMEQVEALVRVDRRRWDLRLRDGALIQLPALDEEDALMRLDQLEQRSRVLSLGFAKIDLRDPELIAVRPRGDRPVPPPAAQPPPAPVQAAQAAPTVPDAAPAVAAQ